MPNKSKKCGASKYSTCHVEFVYRLRPKLSLELKPGAEHQLQEELNLKNTSTRLRPSACGSVIFSQSDCERDIHNDDIVTLAGSNTRTKSNISSKTESECNMHSNSNHNNDDHGLVKLDISRDSSKGISSPQSCEDYQCINSRSHAQSVSECYTETSFHHNRFDADLKRHKLKDNHNHLTELPLLLMIVTG
ncbi:hypothetical protein EB796_018716 [Bugula neritina]|uniref:Uncharacterized protein n=1 Tax=Bugula neritina TaxID=10212 RepID=A0A7J7J9Q7_BUGNE|nr:hypothetical protein EB796_018716 [Bugula neritina]